MVNEPNREGTDRETRLALALFEDTSSTIAGIAGGFLGTIGGLPGIVLGSAAGVGSARLIQHLGAEFHERVLAPRERARAAAALAVAAVRANERAEAGEARRADEFFEARGEGGVPAEELLEGVLARAGAAYDQRRVPHLGALYASIEYRSDITPTHAHQLLRLADNLSYRQLVIIAFFHDRAGNTELVHLGGRREVEGRWRFDEGLGPDLQELADNPGVLGIEQSDGRVIAVGQTWNGSDIETVDALGNITLTALGQLLYELMDLDRIPSDEKDGIFRLMSRSTWDRPDSQSAG